MIIKSMNVKNFRSILDETLYFDNLTALVGANGSGKSSFLHSLELFESKQLKIAQDDFYNKDTDKEIIFTVTFTDLSDDDKSRFKKYIQNDELTVERVFKSIDDKISDNCYGFTLHNSDVLKIIESNNAKAAKIKYEKLKQKYTSFPDWKSFDKTKKYLTEWEEDHIDECKRNRDDGKFFGHQGVGTEHLEKSIKLLYIPAVKDASLDATEGKNSALTILLDRVIRNELMQNEDFQRFQEDYKKRYKKILNIENSKEISKLSKKLTKTLNNYVPDAKINLSWLPPKDFQITLPSAIVNLIEDGYNTTVERTGHGLQRAFIMTLLQYLSTVNENNDGTTNTTNFPTLVLIIEEPELYQHPNRQRHLSEICIKLSKCDVKGVSSKIQVVYSTHSPHFVGLDRINQIRLLRKQNNAGTLPKITKISSTNIKKLTNELSKYHGSKFTEANIIPRLHSIQTPWINEGFFSKCVVLVEGDGDRAAILGMSRVLKIKLESEGISIIPCDGKGNLDKVAIIFQQLKIPVYVVWDNDRGESEEIQKNRILLKLFGQEEKDYPSYVEDNSAAIEFNLETMLKNEIGADIYDTMLKNCMTEYDLKKLRAKKNPVVIETMLEDLEKSGGEIPNTLKQILKKIQQLKQQ